MAQLAVVLGGLIARITSPARMPVAAVAYVAPAEPYDCSTDEAVAIWVGVIETAIVWIDDKVDRGDWVLTVAILAGPGFAMSHYLKKRKEESPVGLPND